MISAIERNASLRRGRDSLFERNFTSTLHQDENLEWTQPQKSASNHIRKKFQRQLDQELRMDRRWEVITVLASLVCIAYSLYVLLW